MEASQNWDKSKKACRLKPCRPAILGIGGRPLESEFFTSLLPEGGWDVYWSQNEYIYVNIKYS